MKTLIITLAFLISSAAFGHECCPKPECQQAKPKVITRTKVVEKIVEKPVPVIVEQERVKVVPQMVPVKVTQTVYRKVQKKNRISLLGGTGPTRVSTTQSEVRLERGAVVGAQYQRMLGDSLSVGVQVQSNETVLGSIGLDF
jgi:hypothetical protein